MENDYTLKYSTKFWNKFDTIKTYCIVQYGNTKFSIRLYDKIKRVAYSIKSNPLMFKIKAGTIRTAPLINKYMLVYYIDEENKTIIVDYIVSPYEPYFAILN